MADFTLNS